MSDLKLAADGATRRYDLMSTMGELPAQPALVFLAWLGEYDLNWDKMSECYTVVRVRPHGYPRSYNFTDYWVEGDNLVAHDKDVILDPYHMCLLYQAHAHFGYQPKYED